MSEITVPDGIEPIRAYRGWKVEEWRGMVRLKSFTQDVDWPVDGPVTATCRADRSWMPILHMMRAWQTVTTTNTTNTGEVVAVTDPEDDPLLHRKAPSPQCVCGVWGVADPWKIKPYDHEWASEKAIVGVVELWGKVIVGTSGWRAEYARPVEIVSAPKFSHRTRRTRRKVATLEDRVADAYGIPILDYWPEITPLEA